MKALWGASTLVLAAVAASGTSLAADLPLKAPKPVQMAAPTCGPYWSVFGGWNAVNSMSDTLPDPPTDGWRSVDFKNGYVVGGAVGRCVPGMNWLRVEGEISYRRNSVDKVTVAGEGTTPRSGHISALAAMANAWADYQVAPNVTVHAGGGIGVASVKLKIDAFSFDIDPPRYGVNDSDTVFAFQLGAGTAWRFSPTMSVTLDYRYFQAVNPTFDVKTSELAKFRDNYQSHSVMVGFRSNFSSGP